MGKTTANGFYAVLLFEAKEFPSETSLSFTSGLMRVGGMNDFIQLVSQSELSLVDFIITLKRFLENYFLRSSIDLKCVSQSVVCDSLIPFQWVVRTEPFS